MLDTNMLVSVKNTSPTKSKSKPTHAFDLLPASDFSFKELTDIYNQTRMDYLVPMPMSEAKLRDYVSHYDVDLERSVIAASKGVPFGLGMLGVRGNTIWITRLGITPQGRKKGVGRAMMKALIGQSQGLASKKTILEVIKKNIPARSLFESLGFQTIRDLLVIRRPPKPVAEVMAHNFTVTEVGHDDAVALLKSRSDSASWVTANESMLNAGNLSALLVDGGQGWLVYQNTPFQLSRIVLETQADASSDVAIALLQELHQRHPFQDTVVENLAADDKHWPAFQALEYITSFVRVEMDLDLSLRAFNKVGRRVSRPQNKPMTASLYA